MKNENAGTLVKQFLVIAERQQQSRGPSAGSLWVPGPVQLQCARLWNRPGLKSADTQERRYQLRTAEATISFQDRDTS